jgi:hypothetical protein
MIRSSWNDRSKGYDVVAEAPEVMSGTKAARVAAAETAAIFLSKTASQQFCCGASAAWDATERTTLAAPTTKGPENPRLRS